MIRSHNQLFLVGAMIVAVPLGVQGQATFLLDNGPNPVVNAPVCDGESNPLEGPDYLAELYGGISPDSLTPAVDFGTPNRVTAPFFTGDRAGYFGTFIVTVMDVPPHGYAWLEVRAWNARLGVTYEDVAALGIGGYGESPVFYAQGGDPEDQFGIAEPLIGLESFSLRPIISEPCGTALLALGGAMLWWTRRPLWSRVQPHLHESGIDP